MKNKHIHFLGIGGSGMSGVACLAKSQGYEVTGCDQQQVTAYSEKLNKNNIPVFVGHDKKHLEEADYLVITAAVLFKKPLEEEVEVAQKNKKLISWQKFLGDNLQKNKRVIGICGTHGKSTTTAMAALVFEKAKIDPSVMIGATVKEWNANFRVGKSDIFITESDEFFDNFLNYKPNVIVINNIEFDHPDYFTSWNQLITSFKNFVTKLNKGDTLIVNQDSPGISKLFKILDRSFLSKVNLIGYTLGKQKFDVSYSIKGEITKRTKSSTYFNVTSNKLGLVNEKFQLNILGNFNVSNALGVIALAKVFKIDKKYIASALSDFNGIGRRMENIGTTKDSNIVVYDDYGHHPTAIKSTLKALRQKYPTERIWAINEPHSFSRTKALLTEYKDAYIDAQKVIIGPIFKARDTEEFGVNGQTIVDKSNHRNIRYIDNFPDILELLKNETKKKDVIIVFGAGDSYKWSQEIYNNL